jgi:hypothetical protein
MTNTAYRFVGTNQGRLVLDFDTTFTGLFQVRMWGGVATVTYNGGPIPVGGVNSNISHLDADGSISLGHGPIEAGSLNVYGNNGVNIMYGAPNGENYMRGFGGKDFLFGGNKDDFLVFDGVDFLSGGDGGANDVGIDTVLAQANVESYADRILF